MAVASLLTRSVMADPALYSSTSGATTSLFTINGQPNPSSNPNESGGEGGGDDFNTGYYAINLSGLTFYGGDTDPNQINYGLQISVFTLSGVRVASFHPSPSEVYGIGWHTLSAQDFNTNNGRFNYTTIPGAGYIVFQPYYETIVNGNTGVTYNAPTGTPQFTLGFGGVPTLGANDPTVSALSSTPGPGVISTGAFNTAAGPTAQYAQFELDGTVTSPSGTTTPVWSGSGSGNWGDSSNWTQGAPNAVDSTANFFEGITANSTVTLTTGETVGTLSFDNPLHSFALAGTSTLTLSSSTGPAALNSWGGSHTISCPVAYTSGLNVTTFADPGPNALALTLPLAVTGSGTLTKLGAGTLAFSPSTAGITSLNLPGLTISAGTVALESSGATANRTVLVASSLMLTGGLLNLGANDADLVGAGASGLATAFTAISQGYNGGTWQGSNGITSSTAAANTSHLTALGVVLNTGFTSTFDGNSTGAGDVLIKYTYYGDTNLDGKVDATDYGRIDASYLADKTSPGSMTGWYNGDFNYDGVINGSDYTLIDNAFNRQAAQISAAIASPSAAVTAQIAAGGETSSVPEPNAIALIGCASLGLLARRRRRTVAANK